MNFVNVVKTQSYIELIDYYDKTLTLPRGEYSGEFVANIKAINVADFTRVVFYDNADGTGKYFTLDKDSTAVNFDFTVQLIVVESYAKAVKHDSTTGVLAEGEYTIAELQEYNKLILPCGFYAVFVGHKADEHAVRIFENQEVVIDNKMADYQKVVLFTLGSDDVRINFGTKEEISDLELMSIAGGKCGVHSSACAVFCPCHIKA